MCVAHVCTHTFFPFCFCGAFVVAFCCCCCWCQDEDEPAKKKGKGSDGKAAAPAVRKKKKKKTLGQSLIDDMAEESEGDEDEEDDYGMVYNHVVNTIGAVRVCVDDMYIPTYAHAHHTFLYIHVYI